RFSLLEWTRLTRPAGELKPVADWKRSLVWAWRLRRLLRSLYRLRPKYFKHMIKHIGRKQFAGVAAHYHTQKTP
ncbi:MAG: hypothetical protein QNJ04_16325, partial [Desulfobacterales bacterium]|nr:hypothetical protein [Desulfobacterales bacterium]